MVLACRPLRDRKGWHSGEMQLFRAGMGRQSRGEEMWLRVPQGRGGRIKNLKTGDGYGNFRNESSGCGRAGWNGIRQGGDRTGAQESGGRRREKTRAPRSHRDRSRRPLARERYGNCPAGNPGAATRGAGRGRGPGGRGVPRSHLRAVRARRADRREAGAEDRQAGKEAGSDRGRGRSP